MKRQLALALIGACMAVGGNAQTIYRCGSAYGTQACEGASPVTAARMPNESEVAASRRETEREMKVATAMEKARLAEEAKGPTLFIPKYAAQAAASTDDDKTLVARKKKPQKPKKPKKIAA